MANCRQVVLVAIVIAVCTAEPIQFRGNRFFARQEVDPSSSVGSAPYPPAGVTPAIIFELPTEVTTAQPDNTYLPPAPVPTPDNTYGPPDNQYGPPAAAQDPAPADQPPEEPQAERIIFVPRSRQVSSAKLRQQRIRLQPLRAASARLQLEPIEIIRSRPVIAYSVQYKSF